MKTTGIVTTPGSRSGYNVVPKREKGRSMNGKQAKKVGQTREREGSTTCRTKGGRPCGHGVSGRFTAPWRARRGEECNAGKRRGLHGRGRWAAQRALVHCVPPPVRR